MLDDLGAVIAHFKTSSSQKVMLLGHSWGAMLATAYINQNPSVINGAILAEPGGLVWQDIMDYKFGLLSYADGAKDSPLGNEGVLWNESIVRTEGDYCIHKTTRKICRMKGLYRFNFQISGLARMARISQIQEIVVGFFYF